MTVLWPVRHHALNKQLRLGKSSVWHAAAGWWFFWCSVEHMAIAHCFLCCVWREDGKMCVNSFYFNSGCWGWLGPRLAACTITFCFPKIIKELYFSKTICNEGVGQDIESKGRILKLLVIQVVGIFCSTLSCIHIPEKGTDSKRAFLAVSANFPKLRPFLLGYNKVRILYL